MLINWQERLVLNHAEFDRDHQKIIVWINELHESARAGDDPDRVVERIVDLIKVLEGHFDSEEYCMDKFCPELAGDHRQDHRNMLGELSSWVEAFPEEGMEDCLLFAKYWFVAHMLYFDKLMCETLASRCAMGGHD